VCTKMCLESCVYKTNPITIFWYTCLRASEYILLMLTAMPSRSVPPKQKSQVHAHLLTNQNFGSDYVFLPVVRYFLYVSTCSLSSSLEDIMCTASDVFVQRFCQPEWLATTIDRAEAQGSSPSCVFCAGCEGLARPLRRVLLGRTSSSSQ
jgi:hypothetical protein